MTQVTCRSCSSSNVIPDAVVNDHNAVSWAPLQVSVRLAHPQTTEVLGIPATRDQLSVPLAARVCGDCGAVDLYAPDAAQLWAATRP